MAYIVGVDRNQARMITTSLDDLIDGDNSVRVIDALEQKSLTDPDSRRMKNNGSLDICYNVQSVVDAQHHFVIDISTTNDINDQNQLYVMAKDATDLLESTECTVIADTGYYNASEIKNCVDDGMTVLIKKG